MISARAVASGALLAVTLAGSPATARSLADRLHQFIDRNGFPTYGDFNEAVTPIVERLATRGIDFPTTATTPAFTYTFNYELGVPERTSESLGPIFTERADTVGKGRLALGVWYLYANLDMFDGHDFADDIVTGGIRRTPGLTVAGAFVADDFSLRSNVTSFSATYGITDVWDVNLVVPIVQTSLALDGTTAAIVQLGDEEPVEATAPAGFEDSAFGLGDLLVRTKYRLLGTALARVAVGLALRLPTGDPENFQGIGDTTVTPSLIVSRPFGRHDVHGSLGVECNAADLERSRARYALGASVQPWERFAFLLDVIGSSSFTDDEFTFPARVGAIEELFGNDDLIRSVTPTTVTAFVPRSDVVDLAVGFKVNPIGTLVGFASVIVPLTNDGLRASAIPTVGLEWSF